MATRVTLPGSRDLLFDGRGQVNPRWRRFFEEVSGVGADAGDVLTADPGGSSYEPADSEVNDLTDSVTWADVPDTNITESSVTQHEAALTIAESQVTDLTEHLDVLIGAALDSPVVTVASNGTVITLSMEKTGTGDVRFRFSDGIHAHDCTPADTVALTAGTDIAPQMNYIYVLQSDKTLTASTVGFPATEFAPIATVFCQSAASAQTDGLYKVHAWTDHIGNTENGHLAHINHWIRHQPATWQTGVVISTSVGAATFDIATTSGEVLQLHNHAYPAFDTAVASELLVANDSATAYKRVSDMVSEITDSLGASMSNKYYNLVIWGVVSEDSGDCQLMVNLPTGSYVISADAQTDTEQTAVYAIPTDFVGVGFLIARLTMKHAVGGNTYSETLISDLRGLFPSTSPGSFGGGGGGLSAVVDDASPQLGGDLDGQATYDLVDIVNADFIGTVKIWDAGKTDNLAISHNGTNLDFTLLNTSRWQVQGALSMDLDGGMDVRLRAGGFMEIYDATNADKVRFSHNGTDFLSAATSTGDWNITGITTLNVSAIVAATGGNSTQWNTAFGWGDHASGGYQADLDVVSQVDAEAGTATDERIWTAERVAQAIAALETGGGSVDAATFYDSTLGQVISTTELTVNLDATSLNTNGSNFSLAADVITVADAGNYKVSYNFKANMTTGTRDNVELFLQRDSGGGYAVIVGTETGMYGRITNTEPSSCSCPPFALALTAGDTIRLRADATGSAFSSEAAFVTIEKIP